MKGLILSAVAFLVFWAAATMAQESIKFTARLEGFAKIPYNSTYEQPKDSPLKRGSGFFGHADRKRRRQYGSIEGTSFMSAKNAPRKVRFNLPIRNQPIQELRMPSFLY